MRHCSSGASRTCLPGRKGRRVSTEEDEAVVLRSLAGWRMSGQEEPMEWVMD